MPLRDLVVIGGSTGSLAALNQIVPRLPVDFPAAMLVVTHMSPHSPSHLAEVLGRNSAIPVSRVADSQPIEPGHCYVAVPDHHLLVVDGHMRLGSGPRENMSRPAIDPLFRSAALSYGSRAVGVILSGLLNDGASGLRAINACGGTAVVQHPLDAEADAMPLAALDVVDADHVAPAAELARVLAEVVSLEAGPSLQRPASLAMEVQIAGGARVGSEALRRIADPAPLSCPDCSGVLSQVRDEQPLRYRCQIGHAQTAEVLAACTDEVDEAMRIALRVMEERVTLVSNMARDARQSGRVAMAEVYQARAEEFSRYAEVLRTAATAAFNGAEGHSSRAA